MRGSGSVGRPAKPTAQKKLQGTYRTDRAVPDEIKPPVTVNPSPPKSLSAKAREIWEEQAPLLSQLKLLTTADHPTFVVYCEAAAEYRRALSDIHKYGTMVMVTMYRGNSKIKTPRPNPQLRIRDAALRTMIPLMIHFGMTPTARTRVSPSGTPPRSKLREYGTPGNGQKFH